MTEQTERPLSLKLPSRAEGVAKLRALHTESVTTTVTTLNKNAQAFVEPIASDTGKKMNDGTFYLGRFKSKDGMVKDWFAAAEDAQNMNGRRLSLDFNDAVQYAQDSRAHGHDDWMLPPGPDDRKGEPDILNVMFNNKSKIGGFGHDPADSWYWSSSPYGINDAYPMIQRFSDGKHDHAHESTWQSVRCVRSVPI